MFERLLAVSDNAGQTLKCRDTAWEKVRGMRPESYKPVQLTQPLYTGMDSQGIVVACFEKCRSLNCNAFIVDLERSVCSEVIPEGDQLTPEPNVTFYHKICLDAPKACLATRLWQVERSLGSVLLDSAAKVVPEMISRKDCYEMCIKERSCKAAQFRTSTDLRIGDTAGSCSLLTIERSTKPQAYRTSPYRDEYLENQCHNISRRDFCSYAEYRSTSLPYSDARIEGLDGKQCEQRCDESRDGFLCRAYGIEYSRTGEPTCFLHSDDTMGAGVSTLLAVSNAFYKEREPCIDMTVRCTNKSLTAELRTGEPFVGRIYASGHSESCGVQGHGSNITRLVLNLPDTSDLTKAVMTCGLTPVFSVDQNNQSRAAIWSTVIVQFNPIIQRLGDQAVKVGCTLFESNEVPEPRNITVQSSYTFIDSNAGLPRVVKTVMNTSSEVPVVSMNILDETLNQANVTHVGQKLILQIKMTPSNGPFDMQAGHLVASTKSGDHSLLLLDEVGCPVSTVFPALSKDFADNRSLVAEFSAFKFPSSFHVRFNAIVRFCLQRCEPVKCNKNRLSYGRKKRSSDEPEIPSPGNVEELHVSTGNGTTATEELLLQTSIIVQDPRDNQNIHPNPLRSKDNPDTVVLLGSDYMDSQFCMNASLALFLLIFLLIIQILLIGSCVLAVRTYRRLAIRAEEDRADILARHLYGLHGGNFEISRRVRWADNNDSTLS
ncbi:uncharacterized protein LOC131667947 isoform X2 [Phymastichus coffea]|uniref:uncharacterized protein LOC131667947 isoform X2 n=1 Tax=Phymastichus coffea TaxID=108790 RepID=UPI00273C41AD|nr:uncharacterized protein LOC131667947 isoform X2 [Phymastichus coffea]